MENQHVYAVELVQTKSIETFGQCYVPKSIMRQEKLQSRSVVSLHAVINGDIYDFLATVWEKRAPSNNLIMLHPCCFKSKTGVFPSDKYITITINSIEKPLPVSIRMTAETTLHTYPSSLTRRLSLYLHDCPLFSDGICCVGSYTYQFINSLPSAPIIRCSINTNILLQQTQKSQTISQHSLQPLPKPLSSIQCPLPGLDHCFQTIISSILYHRIYENQLQQYDFRLFKGILISGDHGLGKTSIINHAIQFCDSYMNLYSQTISQSTIMNSGAGAASSYINTVFTKAMQFAETSNLHLSVVVIDNIDQICTKRSEYDQENTQIVSQLLTCIDGLKGTTRVFVLGTTTKAYLLDNALRRAGRFDKEIVILPPTQDERKQILNYYFKQYNIENTLVSFVDELSLLTRGFSGADIEMFVRQVMISAIETLKQSDNMSIQDCLTPSFLVRILANITPTVMKDQERVTGISWNQIGGMQAVKEQLQKYVEWPILHRDQFKRFNLAPPRGILLYGPPGCAKTTLARALASESHSSFWTLSTSQVFTPYVGESEFIIRSLFARARAAIPAVIFLDEIDALVCKRSLSGGDDVVQSRVMATFLTEMDGIENSNGIIILGATNRPEMIDDALLRPGRFDELIYIPPPDYEARREIFKVYTSKIHMDSSLNLDELAQLTEGYSGADIENICREAVYGCLRENINTEAVTQSILVKMIKQSKPSITPSMIEHYNAFYNAFYHE